LIFGIIVLGILLVSIITAGICIGLFICSGRSRGIGAPLRKPAVDRPHTNIADKGRDGDVEMQALKRNGET
jgi:hypothetical protein